MVSEVASLAEGDLGSVSGAQTTRKSCGQSGQVSTAGSVEPSTLFLPDDGGPHSGPHDHVKLFYCIRASGAAALDGGLNAQPPKQGYLVARSG